MATLNFYVCGDVGHDDGDGTQGFPTKTLNAAVVIAYGAANDGDTVAIHIRGGVKTGPHAPKELVALKPNIKIVLDGAGPWRDNYFRLKREADKRGVTVTQLMDFLCGLRR